MTSRRSWPSTARRTPSTTATMASRWASTAAPPIRGRPGTIRPTRTTEPLSPSPPRRVARAHAARPPLELELEGHVGVDLAGGPEDERVDGEVDPRRLGEDRGRHREGVGL